MIPMGLIGDGGWDASVKSALLSGRRHFALGIRFATWGTVGVECSGVMPTFCEGDG